MNQYQTELQTLRPNDEIQNCYEHPSQKGYIFISTASHGFLVVPKDDKNYNIACKIQKKYGHKGQSAIYLEEDCQAGEFLDAIN